MSKSSRHFFSRVFFIQCVTLLLLALPFVAAAYYVGVKHLAAQQLLTELEPRYARLLGLVEKQSNLKAMADQIVSQLSGVAYPATQEISLAGNDAQQRIRSLFAENKMEIVSVQVLAQPKDEPAKIAPKLDRIRIELRVEGDISGLQSAVAGMGNQVPAIYLESMAVQTIGAVKPASTQRLGAQFTFFVLKVRG